MNDTIVPVAPALPKAPEAPPEPVEPIVAAAEPYRRSESLTKLLPALVAAQAAFTSAGKTSDNPFYKGKYADLAAVYTACRGPLTANGLSFLQPATSQGKRVAVTTILAHTSGEYIESTLHMTAAQDTPQAIGSVITYARRYALSSLVGVAAEDDDGNSAERTLPEGIRQDPGGRSELQKAAAKAGGEVVTPAQTGNPSPPAQPPAASPPRRAPSAVPAPPPGMKPPMKAPGSTT